MLVPLCSIVHFSHVLGDVRLHKNSVDNIPLFIHSCPTNAHNHMINQKETLRRIKNLLPSQQLSREESCMRENHANTYAHMRTAQYMSQATTNKFSL
eukprot:c41526_g1_i1 orf=269-559(-)